ncbi:MAG: DUF106 domain-containing protein [Candidatus Diapherotrites archaeon]|nr:DUF106 domain-containing protein [Candidatus Diapherotrites archaeon]
MGFSPTVDIALVAVLFAVISRVLQHVLLDKEKMESIQAELKVKQKKQKELMARKDAGSAKELEGLNTEMMALMSESMKGFPKLMGVSLVVFLPLWWLVASVYGNARVELFYPFSLVKPSIGWFWWYFIMSVIASAVIGVVIQRIHNALRKKPVGVNVS